MESRIDYYNDLEQGTKEWFNVRKGIVTASEATKKHLLAGKAGFQTYKMNKYGDRFLNKKFEIRLGGWAGRGIDLEPDAALFYEEEELVNLKTVGFVKNHDLGIGCSPDRMIVDENGTPKKGVEIKCFDSGKHIETVIMGIVHDEVISQVQFSMLVTGLKEWDVVYFNPDMKDGYKLKIVTLKADENMHAIFLDKIDELNSTFAKYESVRKTKV